MTNFILTFLNVIVNEPENATYFIHLPVDVIIEGIIAAKSNQGT